ncbi:uncharacterized protein LOC126668629 [Mercurialis annua]|uniref:uncharacterized protein LOC126668629 n=1 Tax=Mercurialis annua TaxID=3986 RepID=UPI0024ADF562|nr:uncharacterized protein LOC126668629 [Mercurialis annua]
MDTDRSWMYRRLQGGLLYPGFTERVQEFVNFALRHPTCMSGPEIKCPCPRTRCKNTSYRDVETVKLHILQKGFVADYQVWVFHGEGNVLNPRPVAQLPEYDVDMENEGGDDFSSVQRMVIDAAGPEVVKHSPLSAAVKMLDIKCRHSVSVALVDDVTEFIQELLPDENKMPKNFAEIKKMVRGLGLPVEVIDCCLRNCMIYWGSDADLTRCKICDHERWKPPPKGNSVKRRVNVPYRKMFYFPITPRLQRLYASTATAKHMTWHAEHEMVDGKMCHPSDSPAWKHFSELHTEFAEEVRNIRLGLCTDGFQPFGAFGHNYSSWPVILTPYNLPPGMCMKDEFMFLTVIVPGPRNPKHQMDIFLQPLIAELNQLWEFGVQTFDVHRRQNFQMKAALLWTINDFPAYSMLSGWSTSGRLACPHCMENTEAFTLKGSRKQSWFDCHRKFLPRGHMYRRNTTDFRKGKSVNKEFGQPKTGEELLAEVDRLGFMKAYEIGAETNNAAKSTDYGWNKKSIFWDLPYWKTELYSRLHSTKADKRPVDKRAQDMTHFPEKWDAIAQRLAAATQSQTGEGSSASPGEVNETQLFLDIEGVNKKHRVYGLGSASSRYAGPSSRTQRGSSSRTSQQTEEDIDLRVQAGIQEGLREVEQRLAEKQRQELAEQLAAARREQQESMAQLIREEIARLMPTLPSEHRPQFPPPPPDGGDTTDL